MTPAAYYYTIQIGFALLQFAFFAGGAWFLLKQNRKEVEQLRKEVNGVGAKVRAVEKHGDERHHETAILFLLMASEEEARSKLAAMLLSRGKS